MKTVSAAEKLRALEDVIETSRRWAAEEAKALATIRRERLYLGSYQTFDQYVDKRHGYDRAHAYRLAAWGDVLDNLAPIGGAMPSRESHARPLYGLTPDQQRDAWREVQKHTGPHRTAAEMTAVVEAYRRSLRPLKSAPSILRPSATVVCGDAAEKVKTLDDASVDLAFFSPPYPEVERDFPSVSEDEFPEWMVVLMTAIRPKLAPKGSVIVNVREKISEGGISDVLLRTRLAIRAAGWREIDVLVWHKPNAPSNGNNKRPRRCFEFLHWFSLDRAPFVDAVACGVERPTVSRIRPRQSEKLFGATRRPIETTCGPSRLSDVIYAPVAVDGGVEHDAKFPLSLADQIVRTFSPANGFVLDPTCGSGTTLVAARNAGRRSWGCDILAPHIREARRRLSN